MKAATDPSSGPTLWPSVNVLLPRSVGNKVIIHGRTPVHQEVESIPRGTWAALICRLQKQTAHFKNHLVHWSLGPQRPTISNCLAFTFRIFSATPRLEGIWRVTTTPRTAIPPFLSFVSLSEKPSTMPWCCRCVSSTGSPVSRAEGGGRVEIQRREHGRWTVHAFQWEVSPAIRI